MPTTRHYVFTDSVHEWDSERCGTVRAVLGFMGVKYPWLTSAEMEGEPLGVLQVSFTVTADHQWRVHQRAMRVIQACYRKAGYHNADVPTPSWLPLPPHRNRGRYRVTG